MALGSRALWQYSHALSILFAVLLFTAGFLCVLLWTNNFVKTDTSTAGPATSTFTQFSPTVSTFSITYQTAIFGTAWNSILLVTLFILEGNALPIATPRLRYEIEKAAIIVSICGNAVYSVACIALMSTLARLAADAHSNPPANTPAAQLPAAQLVAASASDRRAGQGTTAAMAGFAAVAAIASCLMDVLHAQSSPHRRAVKGDPVANGEGEVKQA